MNRVFGRKKAPGPPPPSLGEASAGVGNHIEGMDGALLNNAMLLIALIQNLMKLTKSYSIRSKDSCPRQRTKDLQRQTQNHKEPKREKANPKAGNGCVKTQENVRNTT
jgi:hypothetical protein